MGKPLQITLKVVAALALLVIVLVLAMVFMVDPNRYKPAIQNAVLESTGLELNIAGDLSLYFRPYVGVSLNDVRLRNASKPQELASSNLISLRVDPWMLLRGQLLVQELSADDFHINWFTDANGVNLWTTDPEATDNTTDTLESTPGLSTNIKLISIANASIDIQNLQHSYQYTIRHLDLRSQNGNVENRPFTVEARFELVNPSAPRPMPFTFSSNNFIDLETGDINIDNIQLTLSPLQLRGSIEVRDINGEMTWNGELSSNTFALNDFLDNLAEVDPTANTLALPGISEQQPQQVSLHTSFNGDRSQTQIPSLEINLGETLIKAKANIRFASELSPTNISYEIESNSLDLNLFSNSGEDDTTIDDNNDPLANKLLPQSAKPQSTTDIEIPRSLLSGINVRGTISVESLTWGS